MRHTGGSAWKSLALHGEGASWEVRGEHADV